MTCAPSTRSPMLNRLCHSTSIINRAGAHRLIVRRSVLPKCCHILIWLSIFLVADMESYMLCRLTHASVSTGMRYAVPHCLTHAPYICLQWWRSVTRWPCRGARSVSRSTTLSSQPTASTWYSVTQDCGASVGKLALEHILSTVCSSISFYYNISMLTYSCTTM